MTLLYSYLLENNIEVSPGVSQYKGDESWTEYNKYKYFVVMNTTWICTMSSKWYKICSEVNGTILQLYTRCMIWKIHGIIIVAIAIVTNISTINALCMVTLSTSPYNKSASIDHISEKNCIIELHLNHGLRWRIIFLKCRHSLFIHRHISSYNF